MNKNIRKTKNGKSLPPGQVKIIEALKTLLAEKEFGLITTSEIARTAGVTEALIYKYFKDKRDVLHQVLIEYIIPFIEESTKEVQKEEGAINKLKKIIWCHLNAYKKDRVFGKILILESRSSLEYFKSDTYKAAQQYAREVLEIIKEGVAEGVLRDDLKPSFMRQVIIGGIEYVCITSVALNRSFSAEELSEDLCKLLLDGIKKK